VAEISLSISETSGFDVVSGVVEFAEWPAGFDHAALVDAKRSRADGADLYLYHTTKGPVPFVSALSLDSSSTRLRFNLVQTIQGSQNDNGYRIVFGDLGWQTSRATAAADITTTTLNVVASVPAVNLPEPSFTHAETVAFNVRSVEYPDFAVTRSAVTSPIALKQFQCDWRAISPEDWYEIRAWVFASKGGAGAMSPPTWMNTTMSYVRPMPGTLSMRQNTKTDYEASLIVQELAA